MAGTRLLIVVSFLGPLVAWTAVSILAGLVRYNDLVVLRLTAGWWRPHAAGRGAMHQRAVAAASDDPLLLQNISFPPVTIMTADSQVIFWESAFRKVMRASGALVGQQRVQVVGSTDIQELFRQVCNDPTQAAAAATTTSVSADLWICEFYIPREKARLVLVESQQQQQHAATTGTAVFYPTSITQRNADLQRIYPVTPTRATGFGSSKRQQQKQQRLQFTIVFDRSVEDWKESLQAVHQWIQNHNDDFGPCVSAVDVLEEVQRTEDDILSRHTTTVTAEKKQHHHHLLPTTAVAEEFFSAKDDDDTATQRIVLYIPSKPVLLVDENGTTSRLAAFGNHSLFYVVDPVENNMDTALQSLLDRMVANCLGLPLDDVETASGIASIPSFYEKLYYGRTLGLQYQTVVRKADLVRSLLLALPATVVFPETITEQYWKAVDLITEARLEAEKGNFRVAVRRLERANDLLQELQTDPTLAEPMDFPLEQYAAIFLPLLFPLLVPLFATLFREYKRYRTLVQKRKDEEQR